MLAEDELERRRLLMLGDSDRAFLGQWVWDGVRLASSAENETAGRKGRRGTSGALPRDGGRTTSGP